MGIKILHTADWHLGVMLHNESLEEDHNLFIDWLLNTCLPAEKPDVILISGDIFDKSNPSTNARRQYFSFLAGLIKLGIRQVIITAGNHDSASMLEAPKELLDFLHIKVIGQIPKNSEDLLIPILDAHDHEVITVVAAVPFLRDQDIRTYEEGDVEERRESSMRKAIHTYFKNVSDVHQEKYGSQIPLIGMAHVFASGVTISDSERPVQVGNLADVGGNCFPPNLFAYMALGHIHKPQAVEGQDHIWYSGSPIALSFSEWEQKKIVRMIEVEKGAVSSRKIDIPAFRDLIRVEGSFSEVKQKIAEIDSSKQLPSLIDISIIETTRQVSLGREIVQWIEETAKIKKNILSIIAYRYQFTDQPAAGSRKLEANDLNDITPEKLLEVVLTDGFTEEQKEACRNVFHQILEKVQTEGD